VIAILLIPISVAHASSLCRYTYTVWNAKSRTAEGPFKVQKLKSELKSIEKGPEGCTVCEEDQVDLTLSNGIKFKACKTLAMKFRSALEKSIASGKKIVSVTGYRPSISKGALDSSGRRTEFSRHAFGVALDINEEFNGLYDQCINWGPSCRLIKGGKYSATHPLSISPDSAYVRHFRDEGFLWGGEIGGYQKDFMHFSPDGL